MSKRTHKPPKPKLPRSALASTVLLLSCPPLWGNDGPQLKIDEARSTFRVVGASPNEMTSRSWRKPPLILRGHEGWVQDVSLSADGRIALSGGWDDTVRVWDTATARLLHIMRGHEDRITEVSLSADGRIALSAGFDGTVRVWDATVGKLLHTMEGHEGYVSAVSLNADGRIALSGGEDGTVRVWDATVGKLLRAMQGYKEEVSTVSLSADGRIAVSGSVFPEESLRWWDVATGEPLYAGQGQGYATGDVSLSADGRLAVSGAAYVFHLWDATDGRHLDIVNYYEDERDSDAVSLSADGRFVVSGGYASEAVLLWDIETSHKPVHTLWGHTSWINGVWFTTRDRVMLSRRDDGILRVWEATTGRHLHAMEGHDDLARAALRSAKGNMLLTEGGEDILHLWDETTGKLLHTMEDNELSVRSLSLSADGRLVLAARGFSLRLWRLPVIHPQSALRQAAERYAVQAMEARIGPAIPKPTLPPVLPPAREHEHGPFETMAAFEQHVTRVRTERARQIGDAQARYRAAVEQRNARVRAFEKNRRPGGQLAAYAQAVAEVLGHPVLKALHSRDGTPRYASDAIPPRMYIALQFEHTKDSDHWLLEVPPGDPARSLYEALEAGDVSATMEYRLKDGVLSLAAVYAHHGDLRYKGTPVERHHYSAWQDAAAWMRQLDAPPPPLKRQNPNLNDAAFEQYETRHRPEFEDELESLYEQAEAAEPDPRKWLFAIGIEEYAQANNIPHAARSARWFAKAATKVFGVADERLTVLRNHEATGPAIVRHLNEMLSGIPDRRGLDETLGGGVQEGDHVYLYYAGHGIPAPEQGNAAHILPWDAVPDFVGENEQYRMENIYRQLTESRAGKVIVFLDTCFTGQTEHGSVFKGKADANTRLTPKPFKPPKDGKLAILTACAKNQYPGPHHEKGHRLFSYFLIQELLRGEHASIDALAKQISAHMAKATKGPGGRGKRQNPVLHGNKTLEP